MARRNWISILFSVPSIVGLTFHAYVGSFSRWIADDFCAVSTIQRYGFLSSLRFWYFAWNGRYANSFVDGLLNLLGARGVPYVVPVFLLIWSTVAIFAVAWTLPGVMEWRTRVRLAIFLGVLLVFCTVLLSPNVPQSLYWWGGLRAYTLALMFISLYGFLFQFLSRWMQEFYVLRRGAYLISFLLAFFIAGFSETLSPALVALMAGLVILGIWAKYSSYRSPAFYFLIAGFIGALAGLIVLAAAPGNAVRQAVFQRATILETFPIAFRSFGLFLGDLFAEPESILALCLLGLGGFWAGMQIKPTGKRPPEFGLFLLLFGLVLAYCCFLPAAYSMSTSPPERAIITPIYFLVHGVLAGGYFFGQRLQPRFAQPFHMQGWVGGVLFALLVMVSYLNVSALYSSRAVYIQYARQWDARDAYIYVEKGKGMEKVRVSAMQNWAGLDEPRNRPRYWLNVCMSDYYGIQVLGPSVGQP